MWIAMGISWINITSSWWTFHTNDLNIGRGKVIWISQLKWLRAAISEIPWKIFRILKRLQVLLPAFAACDIPFPLFKNYLKLHEAITLGGHIFPFAFFAAVALAFRISLAFHRRTKVHPSLQKVVKHHYSTDMKTNAFGCVEAEVDSIHRGVILRQWAFFVLSSLKRGSYRSNE